MIIIPPCRRSSLWRYMEEVTMRLVFQKISAPCSHGVPWLDDFGADDTRTLQRAIDIADANLHVLLCAAKVFVN